MIFIKYTLHFSNFSPIGSALTTLGQPVVAVNTVIMAASLANVPSEELLENISFLWSPLLWLYQRLKASWLIRQSIILEESMQIDEGKGLETNSCVEGRVRSRTDSMNGFDYYECDITEVNPSATVSSAPIMRASNNNTNSSVNMMTVGVENPLHAIHSSITQPTPCAATSSAELAAALGDDGQNVVVQSTTVSNARMQEAAMASSGLATPAAGDRVVVKYHSSRLILIHSLCR